MDFQDWICLNTIKKIEGITGLGLFVVRAGDAVPASLQIIIPNALTFCAAVKGLKIFNPYKISNSQTF